MNYSDQVRFAWYQHVIFWTAYILFWSVRDLIHHDDIVDNIQLNLITGFFHAGLAYFNVYVLIPNLLLKRKYLVFVLALLASLSLIAFMNSQVVAYYLFGIHDLPEIAKFFTSVRGVTVLHFEAFFVVMITFAIVMVKIYFIKDNDTQELIKKNLETELNFLKNQINPHFLFNSLNSIYFLIPKNPKKAAEVLLKFSDMLSHQMYEGNKDDIPLEKEIKYLENYIELEKVRQGDRVDIDWSVGGNISDHKVAPMVFLTFLENAFKHGQLGEQSSYQIKGHLQASSGEVRFHLENSNGVNGNQVEGISGVGLENTRRRLELLYPNRHTLTINQSKELFSVDLTIRMDEN